MLLIGSMALSRYFEDAVPNDIDLVGTYDEAVAFGKAFRAKSFYPISNGKSVLMANSDGRLCEIEIAWPNSRAEKLLKFVGSTAGACGSPHYKESLSGFNFVSGCKVDVASPLLLYVLKMSHRFLKNSPHFLKTMRDIRLLQSFYGFKEIPVSWQEFYKEREKDTYTYNHPKLNVSKDGFFDASFTGIQQKYDHDDLHKVVAIYGTPAYTLYQPEGQEVNCSKEMFEQQPHNIKIAGVIEESMVLALERSLIPFPGVKTPEEAFLFALMKVCTSITSGWFREFAWNSYDEVEAWFKLNNAKDCYFAKFRAAVDSGAIKLKDA